jgi:acyl-CoA hydrolase
MESVKGDDGNAVIRPIRVAGFPDMPELTPELASLASHLRAEHALRAPRADREAALSSFLRLDEVKRPVSQLIRTVSLTDCSTTGFVLGGFVLKEMDSCAGLAACRHARAVTVTAGMSPVDFAKSMQLHDVLIISAFVSFASSRSLEVLVTVDADRLTTGEKFRAVTSRFTFVALASKNHTAESSAVTVPPVTPLTKHEEELFARGKEAYEEGKARRLKRQAPMSPLRGQP